MSWYADGNPPCGPSGVPTSSRVDIATSNNVTWQDAFQFDPTGPTGNVPNFWPPGFTGPSWNLDNKSFVITIKGNRLQTTPMLIVDSGINPQAVVIADSNSRIVYTNVPDVVMNGVTGMSGVTGPGLIPGTYVYDWIMYDNQNPSVRIALQHGLFVMQDGVGSE